MRGFLGSLAVLLVGSAVSSAWALDVGDKAPALDIKTWVQGDPVVIADGAGKKVFVVEFWATWCGPCKESIPHLSKLAEKFKGQGLEVVGVSTEELDTVKEFAKDGKFKYHVAVDNDKNTNGAYMEGVPGIPHAFVVDQQGVVVWAGHPMAGLDAVVEKVLAGKFDMAKAKQIAGMHKDLESVLTSSRGQDLDGIAAACDKILDAAPEDSQAFDIRSKVYRAKQDVAGFKALVAKIVPKVDSDWRALNSVAWQIATDGDMNWRDIATAFKAAKRAVEVSQSKESDPLDTLARVYAEAGLIDQAIETQKKAVALDASDEGAKKTLAYYESCAELRKQVGGAPGKKK
jgi:peroxiredoxin